MLYTTLVYDYPTPVLYCRPVKCGLYGLVLYLTTKTINTKTCPETAFYTQIGEAGWNMEQIMVNI